METEHSLKYICEQLQRIAQQMSNAAAAPLAANLPFTERTEQNSQERHRQSLDASDLDANDV